MGKNQRIDLAPHPGGWGAPRIEKRMDPAHLGLRSKWLQPALLNARFRLAMAKMALHKVRPDHGSLVAAMTAQFAAFTFTLGFERIPRPGQSHEGFERARL
jgi:hypothetical protein